MKIGLNNADLSELPEILLSIFDKYSPEKQKLIRVNNSNFVTKNLRKAIMKSSKLRNKYLCKRRTKRKVSIIEVSIIYAWVFCEKIRETLSET